VVLSSGFGETGEAGRALQAEALAAARKHGLRLVGPNCLGLMRTDAGLNATFSPVPALPGKLALLSQSGAICTAILDWAQAAGVGFSSVVSLGAAADVDFGEVLDFVIADPGTDAVLMYVEGIRNARRFVSALRAAARAKPVVVLKAGRHASGTRAASSPTGPAFEGAQISCGQRATAGAIERVRIDRSTLAPRFKVIGCDLWSDDPGFAAATEGLTISGVCGSGIIEVIGEMYLAGVIDAEGVVRGEAVDTCAHIVADDRTFRYVLHRTDSVELSITQNDVRAIQLAKAALRAGIDLLMGYAGVDALGDMRLAGAFGAHIDPLYALVLGLVPDAPVDAVRSVGNAAGAGAVRALLSMQARAELEDAARAVVKIETATEPQFQELFVAAMAFPHATAPSPHLGAVVTLPERTSSADAAGGRRRRRQENRS